LKASEALSEAVHTGRTNLTSARVLCPCSVEMFSRAASAIPSSGWLLVTWPIASAICPTASRISREAFSRRFCRAFFTSERERSVSVSLGADIGGRVVLSGHLHRSVGTPMAPPTGAEVMAIAPPRRIVPQSRVATIRASSSSRETARHPYPWQYARHTASRYRRFRRGACPHPGIRRRRSRARRAHSGSRRSPTTRLLLDELAAGREAEIRLKRALQQTVKVTTAGFVLGLSRLDMAMLTTDEEAATYDELAALVRKRPRIRLPYQPRNAKSSRCHQRQEAHPPVPS
jgi:hypothetical protein